jgi:ComEC/Rec2-related protein
MVAEERAYGHGFLFVPVLIGAGAAFALETPVDPPFWPVASLAALLFAGLAATRPSAHPMRSVVVALGLVLVGMTLAGLETRRAATIILDTPVTTMVSGIVERREPDSRGNWRYILRVTGTRDPVLSRPPERITILHRRGRATVPAAGDKTVGRQPYDSQPRAGQQHAQGFAMGDIIEGRARLSPPSGPALPGLNDFAFSAYFDGIGAVGYYYGQPKKQADASAANGEWTTSLANRLFALRTAIADRIREVVPGDGGAFATAIVTDERRAISEATTEALRVAGLAHIIAISGLNMALAAGTFFLGLRYGLALFPAFAQAWPVKKIAAGGALLMVTAYYLISGFGVSAERAYIMMAIMLGAVLIDRPSISLHNVALSALVVLLLAPSEILGPSFQMSFAATVALVAGYTAWQRRRNAGGRDRLDVKVMRHRVVMMAQHVSSRLLGVAGTSLIGSLSTSIYSIEHFHRIATYGLAANLLSMPLISLIVMPMGLIGMLAMPFGLDAPFLWLMGWGLDGVIGIAKYVASWGGDVPVGRQHAWFLGFGSAGFLLLTLLRTRLALVGLPLLAAAPLLSWHEAARAMPDLIVSEDGSLVGLTVPPAPADRSSGPEGLGQASPDGDKGSADTTLPRMLALNRVKPPDFIYDQWRRALMIDRPLPPLVSTASNVDPMPKRQKSPDGDGDAPPPVVTASGAPGAALSQAKPRKPRAPPLSNAARIAALQAMGNAPVGRFTCERSHWCAAVSPDGIPVIVVEDIRYIGPACDAGLLVIAPSARYDTCRSGALLVSGRTLRRTGALEISFNASPDDTIWHARAAMAGVEHPWTQQRFYDWRSRTVDPSLPDRIATLIGSASTDVELEDDDVAADPGRDGIRAPNIPTKGDTGLRDVMSPAGDAGQSR